MVAWNTITPETATAANPTLGRRVAIVAGARTPLAKMGTALRGVHVTDLAKRVFQETLYRANWRADRLDEVMLGNVVMPADAANPARVAALWAGVVAEAPMAAVGRLTAPTRPAPSARAAPPTPGDRARSCTAGASI